MKETGWKANTITPLSNLSDEIHPFLCQSRDTLADDRDGWVGKGEALLFWCLLLVFAQKLAVKGTRYAQTLISVFVGLVL